MMILEGRKKTSGALIVEVTLYEFSYVVVVFMWRFLGSVPASIHDFVSEFVRDDDQKKTVKLVTSCKIQITPSLLGLIMTNERMTNHNNQWVPPSLRK